MIIGRDTSKLKTLDNWLDEEGIREEVTAKAIIGLGVEQKQGRIKLGMAGPVSVIDYAREDE